VNGSGTDRSVTQDKLHPPSKR